MQSWHEYGAGGLVAASVYSPDEQVGERLAYSYGPFATGTTVYAYHDQLGSVRRWRLANKNNWGANEYQAFGKAYSVSTLAPQDYALHEWDANLAMFRAPYRNYSPAMARWTTEDPLGMVDGPNMYGYVHSPIQFIDALGLTESPHVNPHVGDMDLPESCHLRALRIADNAEGATFSIRHCVATCELKRCYGNLGGWVGTWINYLMDLVWPFKSDDYLDDFDAGNDGALIPTPNCDENNDDYCTNKCKNLGW